MSPLFPLNGSRGLACDVVHDSVDMSDLVDNAVGGGFKNVVGNPRPVGGHEVDGVHGAEGDGVIIGS